MFGWGHPNYLQIRGLCRWLRWTWFTLIPSLSWINPFKTNNQWRKLVKFGLRDLHLVERKDGISIMFRSNSKKLGGFYYGTNVG
jgi:hypothetical protein